MRLYGIGAACKGETAYTKVSEQGGGVLPELWTNDMLGFPPTEENHDEEEQIYR